MVERMIVELQLVAFGRREAIWSESETVHPDIDTMDCCIGLYSESCHGKELSFGRHIEWADKLAELDK